MNKTIPPSDDVVCPIVAVNVMRNESSPARVVYAMLDSESDQDIIAMELAKELELSLRARSVTFQTVESNTTAYRYFANLRIQSIDETYGADVDEALVGSLLTSDGDLAPAKRGFDKLPHAHGIQFADFDAKVQMILSVAHAEAWIGAKIRRGEAKLPSFWKTAF